MVNGKAVAVLSHIDLFSGIGGFALAARRAGIETVQFVEIDPFCQKVLAKNFPGVPIHDDINTFETCGMSSFITTAGFPCQPFSTAKSGRMGNTRDFSECVIGIVSELMPQYAIIENVQRDIIEWIAERLRNNGFRAITRRYSAEAFGAWHKRNRWFVIAYTNHKSEFQGRFDAKMAVMQGMENYFWRIPNYPGTIRDGDGVPNRVDRLRSLGNAIVPQVAYEIMKAILEAENDRSTGSSYGVS